MAFAAAAPLIAAGLSGLFSWLSGKNASSATQQAQQAQQPYYNALTQLVNSQTQRVNQANPVYQALVQMAYQRMPRQARAGVQAPTFGAQPTMGKQWGARVPAQDDQAVLRREF